MVALTIVAACIVFIAGIPAVHVDEFLGIVTVRKHQYQNQLAPFFTLWQTLL
jgi:ABC-type proline/glycine betaine transport system permease subunit